MRTTLILCCLLVAAGPAVPAADFAFDAPGVGKVSVDVSTAARRDDRLAEVRFRDEQGTELLVMRFRQFGPGRVTFQKYVGDGFPSPVVFVASSFARADGVSADLVAVGVVDGGLRKLFVFSDRDANDAACVSPTSAVYPATVVLAQFVDGEYGFASWPKRFRVSTYRWQDHALKTISTQQTQRLHPDWSSALAEVGASCDKEVLESTLAHDQAADAHAADERAVSEEGLPNTRQAPASSPPR
jgi:hypothetical protein